MPTPVTPEQVLRALRASATELAGFRGVTVADVLRNAPAIANAENVACASIAMDAASPRAGKPSVVRAHTVTAPTQVYGAPAAEVKCRACRATFPADSAAVLVPGRFGAFLLCLDCGPLAGVENTVAALGR